MIRSLVLLNGSLDSLLAARLIQTHSLGPMELKAIYLQTQFARGSDHANQAAEQLQIPLEIIPAGDEYLRLVEQPRFCYTEGLAPCVDCRIFLYQQAAAAKLRLQADFLITGEVAGQRNDVQRKRDFELLEFHSGLAGMVVRPLTGKWLPPTLAEQAGWVARDGFADLAGTGRRGQLELAKKLGLDPSVALTYASRCRLTTQPTVARLQQILAVKIPLDDYQAALVQMGRHVVSESGTTVIFGRNQAENEQLEQLGTAAEVHGGTLLTAADILGETSKGPSAIVSNRQDLSAMELARAEICRRSIPSQTQPK